MWACSPSIFTPLPSDIRRQESGSAQHWSWFWFWSYLGNRQEKRPSWCWACLCSSSRGQCGHTAWSWAALTILCTKALLSTKSGKYYIIKSSWKQSSKSPRNFWKLNISQCRSFYLCFSRRLFAFQAHIKTISILKKSFYLSANIEFSLCCCLSPGVWVCN